MSKEDLNLLTKWCAITFVVMLFNPYGPFSYDVFVDLINDNKMVATTIEFMPANWIEHKPFWLLSCLVGFSIIAQGRKALFPLFTGYLPSSQAPPTGLSFPRISYHM